MSRAVMPNTQGAQLRVDALLDAARQRTGLSDFGDPWFMEHLNVLVDCINREAGLPSADVTPVQHVVDMLCDRLKLAAYLKQHPAVHDEEIEVMGVILGQARAAVR